MNLPPMVMVVEVRGVSGYSFDGNRGASLYVETDNPNEDDKFQAGRVCSVMPTTFEVLEDIKARRYELPGVFELTLSPRRGSSSTNGKMQVACSAIRPYKSSSSGASASPKV